MHAIFAKLKRKLKATDTVERCGLIIGNGRVLELDNRHPQPEKGFLIPAVMLVRYESSVTGTWHTHPGDTSVFSQEDHNGFMQWPHLTHFVVGTDGVRAYEVVDDVILEKAFG